MGPLSRQAIKVFDGNRDALKHAGNAPGIESGVGRFGGANRAFRIPVDKGISPLTNVFISGERLFQKSPRGEGAIN